MSLRARVAIVTAAAVTIVVVVSSVVLGQLVARDARARLDDQLLQQSRALADVATRLIGRPLATEAFTRTGVAGELALGTAVTLTEEGQATLRLGAGPRPDPAAPDGFATVDVGGDSWRTHTTTLTSPRGPARLQVAASADVVDEAISAVRSRTWLVGLLGIALAAATTWWLAGRITRPLDTLADAAAQVATSGDLTVRVPDPAQPTELAALARTVNQMLARIEAAAADREQTLADSRAFAADVAHELRNPLTSIMANLDVLSAHPDMDPTDRADLVAAAGRELGRLGRTVDALHALAQADAASAPHARTDLAEIVDAGIGRARTGSTQITANLPTDPVEVVGDPDALSVVVDNLLRNAARHGHRPAEPACITVTLRDLEDHAVLTIDDEGPGLGTDPGRLLGRSTRGRTFAPGSGLGLAIAARRVHAHGGSLTLANRPTGGARVEIRLPRATPAPGRPQ